VTTARILGIDPGLNRTGWGVIDSEGNRLRHVAHGVVTTRSDSPTADRLSTIHEGLLRIIAELAPAEAAVEEVFVNRNPASTLKLGMARGVALLAPAGAGLAVAEYAANLVKKSVVGTGHADKAQIAMMVGILLPGSAAIADAADALAVAICHAHHRLRPTASLTAPRPNGGKACPQPDREGEGADSAREILADDLRHHPLTRIASRSDLSPLGRGCWKPKS
jgi:crossover junction endodeoxyribonuclease RuvC